MIDLSHLILMTQNPCDHGFLFYSKTVGLEYLFEYLQSSIAELGCQAAYPSF